MLAGHGEDRIAEQRIDHLDRAAGDDGHRVAQQPSQRVQCVRSVPPAPPPRRAAARGRAACRPGPATGPRVRAAAAGASCVRLGSRRRARRRSDVAASTATGCLPASSRGSPAHRRWLSVIVRIGGRILRLIGGADAAGLHLDAERAELRLLPDLHRQQRILGIRLVEHLELARCPAAARSAGSARRGRRRPLRRRPASDPTAAAPWAESAASR